MCGCTRLSRYCLGENSCLYIYETNFPRALAVPFRYETVYEIALLLNFSHTRYGLPRCPTGTTPPLTPPINHHHNGHKAHLPRKLHTEMLPLGLQLRARPRCVLSPLPKCPFYLLSPKLTLTSMQSPQLDRRTQYPQPHGQPVPSSDVDIREGVDWEVA